ncbi:MAG: ROK family protein [Cognatishimia sp.]|uniref:glucokinase n=1 Tax=Cognatishimia sp. TaxID=2211648 RepID=UPI003B8CB9C0
MTDTYLVADIGGTNTRVGLANETGLIAESTRRFKNSDNESFTAVLEAYLAEMNPPQLRGACAGAAGPVKDGVAALTNLDWQIDRDVMRSVTGAAVADVINDLPAQGLALNDLSGSSTKVLKPAEVSAGPRLVVGLGTGFNIVPVHQVADMLIAPSCEAGHETLPYRADQAALCDWLKVQCGYPSVEVALAGQGIENIFEFHAGKKKPAADIVASYHEKDAHAVATMRDYVALLGAVVGDHALVHLPFGGIYLTGGVSRSVAPLLSELGFLEHMQSKGRFSTLAGSFQISLIDDDYAALKGCARHLRQIVDLT